MIKCKRAPRLGNTRILIISGFADSIIEFRGDLLKRLVDKGLEVHIAAPELDRATAIKEALIRLGVSTHSFTMERNNVSPIRDLKTLLELVALNIRIRPSQTLAYNMKAVAYGLIAARIARVPLRTALITGLGYAFAPKDNLTGKTVGYLARSLYRVALRRAKCVIFQNQDDREEFKKLSLLHSNVNTAVVNGSGVCTQKFMPKPLPTHENITFLMISRLLRAKGVREYASAAGHIKLTKNNVTFLLAGWNDEGPDSITEQELRLWTHAGNITFLGRLPDVRAAIAGAHVYVLPSYREGTPRSVLEAMAMARPIITTDAPGCRETVIEGRNGLLVKPKSIDELVKAMMLFVENPELMESMGSESRRIAEEKFDVEKVSLSLLTAIGY